MAKAPKSIELNNRQAYFNYQIEDKYVAGIVLMGTEVKSIRAGKVSFNDSFCFFDKGNLIIILNGFQKKTDKTPKNEIEKAEHLKQKYYEERQNN